MLLLILALARAAEPEAPPRDPAAVDAEYWRLHDEMQQLVKRQVWSGVAKHYAEMESLGVPMRYEDYLAGAMAARDAGDVSAAYARLTEAAKLDGTREVVEWLWTIDTQYGRVSLSAGEVKGPVELQPAMMPFLPDQRKAVEYAQAQVAANGSFNGFLPEGKYSFAGQEFTVTPGPKQVEIVVHPADLEPKKRR